MADSEFTPSARNLVIVLVEAHPKAILLLRMARKRAQERNGRWRAIFIETPAHHKYVEDGSQERILRLLTTAEQMDGESEHIEASSVEKGIEALCKREEPHLGLFIIGSSESSRRFSRFRMMPWMRSIHSASQHVQVEIVPLTGQVRQSISERFNLRAIRPLHIMYALLAVAVAAMFSNLLQWGLPPALFRVNEANVGLLFMIACAFSAGRYGLLPGLVASIAGFVTENYYFSVPYHTIKLDMVTDILGMGLFLSAAILISLLTSQTRGYAQNARKRELATQLLFTLYRIATESSSRQRAIEKLQLRLEKMLDVDVAVFVPPTLSPDRIEAVSPAGLVLSENDYKALDVCWRDSKTTGLASPYNPGTSWRFEAMISSGGEIGVIGVKPRRRTRIDAWFGRLLTAIADQTANVLEHIELTRSMENTRISEEREKLRSMLLSSVSHDLKTPLAGIIGALSVYQSLNNRLSAAQRAELIEASLEEAQRLDSFITNILDMTRLESGNIKFRQEWYYVQTMVDSVRKRLRHRLKQRQLIVHPIATNLEAFMDVTMTEQVLQNMIDNACKYTPEGTSIEIACWADDAQGLIFTVRDHGDGLPKEKLEQAFDKYARLHKQDSQVAGTGLGLAISKAVIEAQKGWIKAENHPEGGALFTFSLPLTRCIITMLPEEKAYATRE